MRLIDADALPENAFEVQTQEYGNIEVVGLDAIDGMVTIDAEPVVHCGDCKFRCDFTDGHCECRRWPNIPMSYQRVDPQFDFCSYGERKETD